MYLGMIANCQDSQRSLFTMQFDTVSVWLCLAVFLFGYKAKSRLPNCQNRQRVKPQWNPCILSRVAKTREKQGETKQRGTFRDMTISSTDANTLVLTWHLLALTPAALFDWLGLHQICQRETYQQLISTRPVLSHCDSFPFHIPVTQPDPTLWTHTAR